MQFGIDSNLESPGIPATGSLVNFLESVWRSGSEWVVRWERAPAANAARPGVGLYHPQERWHGACLCIPVMPMLLGGGGDRRIAGSCWLPASRKMEVPATVRDCLKGIWLDVVEQGT